MKIDAMKSNSDIGSQLKRYRLLAGLGLKDVAAHLNKSTATVSHWETGRRSPDPDSFIKLLDLYGVENLNAFKVEYHNASAANKDEEKLLCVWRKLTEEKRNALMVLIKAMEA